MPKQFSIGADPEVAVCIGDGNHMVPAWDLTSGLKQGPKQKITAKGLDVDVHSDGVALEYNYPPQPDADSFVRASSIAHKAVWAFIREQAKAKNVDYKPWVTDHAVGYTKEALLHPIAQEIGCDPDYDAYSANPDIQRVIPKLNPDMKYFGGHIHIGYNVDLCPPWAMARLMDLFVYMPLARYDFQNERKLYYGQPGIFRPKPYGMEYRTPGNIWISSADLTTRIAYNSQLLVETLEKAPDQMFDFFERTNWPAIKNTLETRNSKLISQQSRMAFATFPANELGVNFLRAEG